MSVKIFVVLQCSEPQGGALRISSDEDDQRIFLGLNFSILEIFWVKNSGKYFFFFW